MVESVGSLDDLQFSNRFTGAFPADPVSAIHPRPVREFYSRVSPTPVAAPSLVAASVEVADLVGIDRSELQTERFASVFGGNELLDGMDPFAMNYAGHQFGNFAGQLGDGRAIALGEVATPDGGHQTLQLKGAGPTPYSRRADGRAVLRSSVREFLCSEAMWHLGVPTTRALSLVRTGDEVVRDMFYDGHPAPEPGAVVCRVAPSFIRFGHFELPASRRDPDGLEALARFVLETEFPELGAPGPSTWIDMVAVIAQRTAELMAEWMRVGFVHGVMNTDNLTVAGITIDYGPYGWVDDFDPGWTPNTTDAQTRRYRFGQQPSVAYWNLGQLASALAPLIGAPEGLQSVLDDYPLTYRRLSNQRTAAKLGFGSVEEAGVVDADGDVPLFARLFRLLSMVETDFTIFFQNLADLDAQDLSAGSVPGPLLDAYYQPELPDAVVQETIGWLRDYGDALRAAGVDDDDRRLTAFRANPRYVLRNYLAQEAIEKAEAGDDSLIERLQIILRDPYTRRDEAEDLFVRRPDWARTKPGASALSCSS